jgi:large subunit ribosomal protein L10
MNLEQKKAEVEELKGILVNAKAMVLLSANGLNMEATTGLRRALRKENGAFRVIKNTLFNRAADGTPWQFLGASLKGPLAVAYTEKDPAAFAKALTALLKGMARVKVVGGALGTRTMDEAGLKALASLPPADVLQAMLLGAFTGVPRKFLGLLQAPARDFMGVLKARERQLEEQAGQAA